nr:FUSC family protein [Stutzerimonas kunmingensis]
MQRDGRALSRLWPTPQKTNSMNMPTWREWLFSAKALIAALLALYIALAIPLENPYWAMASVYVVSHPLSGATRSKAIYRALGTLLGAAASVVLLPTFAQQPVMLSLAISLWIGALLFLSLLDRSPRSYIFLLAAYTVPLISLAEVNHPATIFDVALARSEEILLGIVCASVVNAVLFPSRIAPTLAAKMHLLLRDGRGAVSRMLNPAPGRSRPACAECAAGGCNGVGRDDQPSEPRQRQSSLHRSCSRISRADGDVDAPANLHRGLAAPASNRATAGHAEMKGKFTHFARNVLMPREFTK